MKYFIVLLKNLVSSITVICVREGGWRYNYIRKTCIVLFNDKIDYLLMYFMYTHNITFLLYHPKCCLKKIVYELHLFLYFIVGISWILISYYQAIFFLNVLWIPAWDRTQLLGILWLLFMRAHVPVCVGRSVKSVVMIFKMCLVWLFYNNFITTCC